MRGGFPQAGTDSALVTGTYSPQRKVQVLPIRSGWHRET